MKVADVLFQLNEWSPLGHAEDFDNVGLLIGDLQNDVSGILVSLDSTETIVEEAIQTNCNLIVCFHPIIFKGLKSLTGSNYVERTVQKAIKKDVAIIAIHTALDNHWNGVNHGILKALGLKNKRILIPKKGTIQKLTTYIPEENFDKVRNALFAAGAGNIGNYSQCSFGSEGRGTFLPKEEAQPVIGVVGQQEEVKEKQLHITFDRTKRGDVLKALFDNHPYDEVAYELQTLENHNQKIGMGMLGDFEKPMKGLDFIKMVKTTFKCGGIRHSKIIEKPIKSVAVLGGSGAFAIAEAKSLGADAFITSDLKYHNYFEAEGEILLLDIGHYESEQFTKKIIGDFLREKFPNFAVNLAKNSTNPIFYFS